MNIVTKTARDIVPTIEINHKLERKKRLSTVTAALFMIIEGLCVSLLFWLFYQVRIAYEFNQPVDLSNWDGERLGRYILFFFFASCFYLIFIYSYQLHKFRSSLGLIDELYKMAKAHTFAVLITIGISFFMKYGDFSRLVIVGYWLGAMLMSAFVRVIKRQAYFYMANQGLLSKNVMIVGAGKVGTSLMEELDRHRWLGYRVIGYVDDFKSEATNSEGHTFSYLGKTSEINGILKSHLIDELIITIPSERKLVNQLITDLRKIDIQIKIVPDLYNLMMSTVQIGNINSLPVVSLIKTPMQGAGLILKRLFDIILASLFIIISSPVFLFTAIAIKLDSKGPIFYKQKRIGKNGKPLQMLKFRSMVLNAETQLQSLLEKNDADGGIVFKMKSDPRVTKIGKFIRKFSIDELPQLFNVLKGEMSLVGPRPPLPHEVELYDDWEWRRLEVLPGITGLWQVSGRSDLSFQQWVNLDVYYIENWSLGLDLKILFKTIPVVLKGEGAY
ncbi:sugar transferase [Paenibacillus turpanensis]|uniref:sugar transferase n=1 Tax=Paenibacillus turpanensis TaxID=2689078 RepID=UPI00140E4662|nr:sugar transferase [Paenibacillus turpanensis]